MVRARRSIRRWEEEEERVLAESLAMLAQSSVPSRTVDQRASSPPGALARRCGGGESLITGSSATS